MSKGKRKPRAGSYREATFKEGVRTVKETVDVVSFVTGEHRSRVNQFARKLIDDGLLPKSIGRDVKKVGPEAAMLLIFAIGHATRTADVTFIAKKFMQLPSVVLSGSLLKLVRDIGIRHEPNVIDALKFFLTVKEGWLLVVGIGWTSYGKPYVGLQLGSIEKHTLPKEITTRSWYFFHGHEMDRDASRVSRVYEISELGVFALRRLMRAPNIPNDPDDFGAFLRGDRGDIEDDQAVPDSVADEIQAILDRHKRGEGGDG